MRHEITENSKKFGFRKKNKIKTERHRFLDYCSENLKSKTCTELRRIIQNPKWVELVALGVAFTLCGAVAQAQQPTKIPRIGYVSTNGDPSRPHRLSRRLAKVSEILVI